MLLCFTTSVKNDGNSRSAFQKVRFQGHLWKANVASPLEVRALVGTGHGGRDGVTSARGRSKLGVCRDLVMKPASHRQTASRCLYGGLHTRLRHPSSGLSLTALYLPVLTTLCVTAVHHNGCQKVPPWQKKLSLGHFD